MFQAMALIELYNAPEGRYNKDVYLLPKKMGKLQYTVTIVGCSFLKAKVLDCSQFQVALATLASA